VGEWGIAGTSEPVTSFSSFPPLKKKSIPIDDTQHPVVKIRGFF